MMYSVSKILPLFVLPLGVAIVLVVLSVIFRKRWMGIAAAGILYVSSTPLVSNAALSAIEGDAVRLAASAVPTADAVVVLSTGRSLAPGPARVSEWSDPDRFFAGLDLYRAGRAPLLVFTGGWSPVFPDVPLEGDVLAGLAQELGVPASAIMTTGRVANTEQEAGAVGADLKKRGVVSPKIILVTSAFHMPRATGLFRRAALEVFEFPVDFRAQSRGVHLLDLVPDAGAFSRTHVAIRELYGRAYYAMVGS